MPLRSTLASPGLDPARFRWYGTWDFHTAGGPSLRWNFYAALNPKVALVRGGGEAIGGNVEDFRDFRGDPTETSSQTKAAGRRVRRAAEKRGDRKGERQT